MQEIQLAILKFIRFLLVAALVPIIGMLILAAINERIRRIVLGVMTFLAVAAVIAYLILAPRNMATVEDWSLGAAALEQALLAGLPFIFVLAVVGIGAYLLGPSMRARGEAALQRHARIRYLTALLDWVAPQMEGSVELEGRELPRRSNQSLRITGDPGSGKSTLLRHLLQERARRALANESEPLPIWVDMDDILMTSAGAQLPHLEMISPVQTRFLGWLVNRAVKADQLIFLVDGSVQSFGMTYARSEAAVSQAASALESLISEHRSCTFLLALPHGVQNGTLIHKAEKEYPLSPLSKEGVRAGMNGMVENGAEKLNALLMADGGIWHTLAARPAFLRWLAGFYRSQKRLPKDLRELFRVVLYPDRMAVEQVEAALSALAEKNLQTGQYWVSETELQNNRSKAPARIVQGLVQGGLLRSLPASTERGRPDSLVGFAHPIFLAYATALSWFTNRAIPIELEKGGQPRLDLDGAGPRPAQALENDPVLADALVFFNNLEADPQRLAGMLEVLTGEDAHADAGGFRWSLAAQCLLAMPAANRPRGVVEKTAGALIQSMAYDEQAGRQALQLLEPYDEAARIAVFSPALSSMDETRLEQTLRRITERPPGGEETGYPDFLRSVLWYGEESLGRMTGWVWANCEPGETMAMAQELYEHGPAERRGMAIELMGKLPEEAAARYLNNLLLVESDPALRIAILKSLAACGAEETPTLLTLLADERENDLVRNFAAGQLSQGNRPELREGGMVRELVRISHLALPEKARGALQQVMDHLRGVVPETTTRWEEVVNPYLVGRPATNPALFFGREQLLRDLHIAVDQANPVMLTGERGSGKTSLLYQARAMLEKEAAEMVPVRAVYLDLMGLEPHEFFETTIRAIIEGLRDPALIADPNVPRPYTDQRFARDLWDVLVHIRSRLGPHSRLALLVDNADVLATYPDTMHAALKRISEAAIPQGLVMVLAGSDAARARTLAEQPVEAPVSEKKLFYADWLNLKIPRLTQDEARRLITEPVAGTFQYEAGAVDAILQAAQGRPGAIQETCQKLVSTALASGSRAITAKMAAEVLRGASPRAELLSKTESVLNRMMDWLEATPDASPAQIEEQMKQTWGEVQKTMVQQVIRARKDKGRVW